MATRAGTAGLSAERRFFALMACAVLLSTFIGFAPSWYLRTIVPPLHPYEPLTPLVVVHGVLFSAWVILFAAQTALVAAGRVDIHRRLGLIGIALVALMIPVVLLTALGGVARPLTAAPGVSPLSWLAIPLLDVPVFSGLIIAALANRRRPATHKRLMLVAMVDMMRPSLGRLPVPVPVGVLILPLLFLVPLIVWDVRTKRRVTPATLWGSLTVAAVTLLPGLIWTSPAWLAFAREASKLAP